jgi:hypothetical protein
MRIFDMHAPLDVAVTRSAVRLAGVMIDMAGPTATVRGQRDRARVARPAGDLCMPGMRKRKGPHARPRPDGERYSAFHHMRPGEFGVMVAVAADETPPRIMVAGSTVARCLHRDRAVPLAAAVALRTGKPLMAAMLEGPGPRRLPGPRPPPCVYGHRTARGGPAGGISPAQKRAPRTQLRVAGLDDVRAAVRLVPCAHQQRNGGEHDEGTDA